MKRELKEHSIHAYQMKTYKFKVTNKEILCDKASAKWLDMLLRVQEKLSTGSEHKRVLPVHESYHFDTIKVPNRVGTKGKNKSP